ncbi:MAG: helix-turn-helix domain-containing protein [Lentisphaeria bacterium]|nr:helix-turn-helix domain-containing protein [Lentisphaeria bacterium]
MNTSEKRRRALKSPCRLLSAQEILRAGQQRFARENYPVLTVEYVSEGAGFLEINGKSFHIRQDSIYFLTPGSTHVYQADKNDPWSKLFFVVYGDLPETLLHLYALDEVYCIPDCPELKKYFREMIYLKNNRDPGNRSAIVLHSLFNAAARKLANKKKSAAPEIIELLKKSLDESLEKHFSLADFAAAHSVKESSLIRAFKRCCGTTPHGYLMESKLREAENYLLYTSLSIKEIAALLAFSDQYHFSNTFKRRKGCSPTEFRSASPVAAEQAF